MSQKEGNYNKITSISISVNSCVLGFIDTHSPKSLLSCRVPQKQFDHNIRVKVHVMHLEIDPQWRLTGFIKRSFSEAMQKR